MITRFAVWYSDDSGILASGIRIPTVCFVLESSNFWNCLESDRQVISFWRVKDFSRFDSIKNFFSQKILLNLKFCQHASVLTRSPKTNWNVVLGDWFSRKNSRGHNSVYNIYWLLKRFKFVQWLTWLFPSNLEVHFTSVLSWPARNINRDVCYQFL